LSQTLYSQLLKLLMIPELTEHFYEETAYACSRYVIASFKG